MITDATRFRRLRSVLKTLISLNENAADLSDQLQVLKERAKSALYDTNLGRGNSPHLKIARQHSAAKNRQTGKITEKRIRPIIKQLRAEGFDTYEALAVELLKRGIKPARAKTWGKSTVRNIEIRHLDE